MKRVLVCVRVARARARQKATCCIVLESNSWVKLWAGSASRPLCCGQLTDPVGRRVLLSMCGKTSEAKIFATSFDLPPTIISAPDVVVFEISMNVCILWVASRHMGLDELYGAMLMTRTRMTGCQCMWTSWQFQPRLSHHKEKFGDFHSHMFCCKARMASHGYRYLFLFAGLVATTTKSYVARFFLVNCGSILQVT